MNRRRRANDRHSQERWLLSYADFITLLFACFVVLFASSGFDEKKTGTLAAAIQHAFHGGSVIPAAAKDILDTDLDDVSSVSTASDYRSNPRGNPLEKQLRTTLSNELDRNLVTLDVGSRELTLSLKEVGYFDSGSAELREGSAASIARIAGVLMNYSNAVRIEGHTDNVPIATTKFASNWELSSARAIEITRMLTTRFGIAPARLAVAGFAEYRPVKPNSDSAGRAANRRVDIVIIGPATLAPRSSK
jgi:chemotaxis protein MotB